MRIKVFSITDKGRVRKNNEDCLLLPTHLPETGKGEEDTCEVGSGGVIFALADGMGGMLAGEIASRLAIEAIKEMRDHDFFPPEIHEKLIRGHLDLTFMHAQTTIEEHGKENPDSGGMGTTLVVGYFKDNNLHVAWLGDSRCYVYRKGVGLRCITRDHSYVQTLVDEGRITMDEAFDHPGSNIITRCLQCIEDNDSFPDHVLHKLESGDRVLFCSDGLNTMLRDVEISEILAAEPDTRSCTELLVSRANDKGGKDNVTVIMVDVMSM